MATVINQELLLELTESYLKSLIARVSGSLDAAFDSFTPFGELGIDSFYVLKIIKALEADFGTLPKTLLFENFNINDLVRYFVDKHPDTLGAKFGRELQGVGTSVHEAGEAEPAAASAAQAEPAPTAAAPYHAPDSRKAPILLLESEARTHPVLGESFKKLFDAYKNEGTVSRGTRIIAPNLFIGGEGRGYFNYGRSRNTILAYGYTGADDYFPEIAREMHQFCMDNNLQFNILTDTEIQSVGATAFTATPFGAMQRVLNIREFTLDGQKMRRLRYQVSKFEKAGKCRTEEYHCGTNSATDRDIVRLIDEWCAAKTMVNPLVHVAREEILAGAFSPDHRIFLTYIGDVLQNAIIITEMSPRDNGYLMDLEFYPREMPLGGLEYAIVNIIRVLADEGRGMFSLGATLGPKLASSPNADPQVDAILDGLREKNIFNDEGNLQFKNKFRPENKTIFLCRPAGSDPDNVIDIIMMIADPLKMRTSDEEHHNAGASSSSRSVAKEAPPVSVQENPAEDVAVQEPPASPVAGGRSLVLSESGYNPLNIPVEQVDFDLKTDSWAELDMPAIERQMKHLHSQLQHPAKLDESLKSVFPFRYFALATSGRNAEYAFCKAWDRKGAVLQNLLFPTLIFHQIDNGLAPEELPHPQIFEHDTEEPYKGNLDWEALQARVERDPSDIAFVCIELSDNAAGGYPVSMQHLKQVKTLLSRHSIPLVIDGTRIVENARFVIENDPEYTDKNVWQVAREISAQADVMLASLTKDFCVNKGGLIATNDANLFGRVQDLIHEEGSGLDVIDKKAIALSLKNLGQIETQVLRRMEWVRQIWSALKKAGVPVVGPAGAHCILIDVKRIPEFRDFQYPVASFAAWVYLNTGIRVAAHNPGMQKGTAINNLVRLAIPIGLKQEDAGEIAQRMVRLFENRANIPEIQMESRSSELFGDLYARYRLKKYHNASAIADEIPVRIAASAVQPVLPRTVSAGESASRSKKVSASAEEGANAGKTPARCKDIAIVGMSGRYPKAKNLEELWENLVQGRDCIDDIPEDRLARRFPQERAKKYRAGFMEGVDRFDSLFFNISPREAEMLDPQERLFLEVAWEAIEDAGYYPETLVAEGAPRNIGVYVGAVWAMYQMLGVEEKLRGNNVNPNSFLWSIANRVSYYMNLSGPSLTIDTACSSSLSAIYLACEAIYNGECSGAIVGGVNLDLHQSKHDINESLGALSSDGVCRSFGKGANGYVPGEGIGALFLKPLDQAVRDGDNIHGVIKSVVVNHGGRTSGYTVPNPKAQTELILSALRKADIDARSIGYIEAHGTGTELGDPIEITGLRNAFETYGVRKQSCAVGSIKTNIGHLEAAAGVVSVCKVLLQMKHRRLVPSLHSSELNEFIDFENSPFYVGQKTEDWRAAEIDGVRFPLRAGVSSFGAGGANAHIILEHYEPADPPQTTADTGELIFPLSARNEEQLRKAAIRLKECIEQDLSRQPPAARRKLRDIAFTLQVGRKSFEHRLAIIAATAEELAARLGRFVAGEKDEKILAGHTRNSEGITRFLNRKEKEEFINLLSKSRDPAKLAQIWIEGLLPDWQGGHAQGRGRRVSLPTYPFADKRHWAAADASRTSVRLASIQAAGAHPLVDSNESTFERQFFRKTFHEGEFFIYDHLVSQIPTLPGVAYLEIARKAGELAAGRKVQKIKNILWVSPLTVRDSVPTTALIELKPNRDAVQFEVFSESADGRKQLYSQGKLAYASRQDLDVAPEFIDIASIRARCAKVMDGKDAYPLFKSLGLNLGPSFQVLQEVFKNESEVLGALKIPEVRSGDFHDFLLHPSLVDGSLQAAMAAQLGDTNRTGEMFVPYSIGEVEILHPLETDCFSYVKQATEPNSKVSKANVFILNREGKVLVKIRESIGVPLTEVHEKPVKSADAEAGFSTLYYSYEWESSPLDLQKLGEHEPDSVLIFDRDAELSELYRARLRERGTGARAILVRPGETFEDSGDDAYRINPGDPRDYMRLIDSLNNRKVVISQICFAWSAPRFEEETLLKEALDSGVYSLLFLCQSLIAQKSTGKIRLLYVYRTESGAPQPHNDAINGFAKTLQVEHPKLGCKILEIAQENAGPDAILDAIVTELHPDTQDAMAVRYEGSERHVRKIRQFDLDGARDPRPAGPVENGVYLITGGAGGLGLIFAEYLAREFKAKLVLTGRSSLSPARAAKLEEFRNAGAEVLYIPADVSRREEVERLVNESKSRFGRINGIIHSAGVLRDSFIRNKTVEEMGAVFAPKIYGSLHLDAATRNENLDFFVMFSSIAAVGGNMGQCDYSFANHFMDSFAARRELLRANGERSGRTLSLNWSLWADGGMTLDDKTETFFRNSLGIKPLTRETGFQALTGGLAANKPQFLVFEGQRDKIERAWGLKKEEAPAPAATSAADTHQGDDGDLLNAVQNELSQLVMEFLKLDAEDIDADKILLDLGFDSIGLTTYANAINEKYQLDVTPVLFFEYPSVREIARYLAAQQKNAVLKVHAIAAPPRDDASASRPAAEPARAAESFLEASGINKGWDSGALDHMDAAVVSGGFSPERRFIDRPIAIVGMSGVMPLSEDLEEFWDNLKNARNLITIIPEDRWIWQDFHGDPLKDENTSNSKWGGFMKEIDKFDPLFFGISPREAESMDPQQRIFLQTVWKTIEDSGHKVSDLSGTKTGLFVGVSTTDYADLLTRQQHVIDGYTSTGNTHSVLVNRISFLLNLHGPSAPFDTACSSSLVAIHRALESIHTGSCEMAIAGGVQIMTSPNAYISFGQAGMLSDDGKCKTFDKRANGYVRGEGSGAIFLKPLAMAEADGNHIYAVIKATSENHGGRVTTMTAPNPNAQYELLFEAYEKSGIDPTTVGYIECHGTGTSLGDPIEIQALTKTFSELYKKHNKPPAQTPHCGLGSVKTNIGHLETAAGIAGVLKTLLAIRHRQIPASLHFEEINPYINLKGTPFYIVDKTVPWEAPAAADGKPVPRRAGVSSFGFGGANAHVVLEEYLVPETRVSAQAHGPQLIVLSARNEQRLRAYAEAMLACLEKEEFNLADFAYTLQTGRDPMVERLALVVDDGADLKRKFTAFLQNAQDVQGLYRDKVRKGKKAKSAETEGRAGEALLRSLVEQKDLARLAELWVAGAEIDWMPLHAGRNPRRLSLPTYPFAKERYWIPAPQGKTTAFNRGSVESLHSLIHRNVSTLKEQKFTSRFTGKEFYFADHVVETQKILPGVAYLEMARAAGELSGEAPVRFIRNLVWARPITVGNEAREAEVVLTPRRNEVEFAVRSRGKEHSITHCTGSLAYSGAVAEPEFLDLAGILQRCSANSVVGKDLYAFLSSEGLKLGKAFQVVQEMHAAGNECLVTLQLPEHLKKESGQFLLHPSLMDGPLHSAIGGLVMRSQGSIPMCLPYSVGEVQLLHSLQDLHYGHAAWNFDPANIQAGLRLTFHLLDKDGKVLLRMKDFLAKPFIRTTSKAAARAAVTAPGADRMYYQSEWKESAVPAAATENSAPGHILIFDKTPRLRAALEERLRQLHGNASALTLVQAGAMYREITPNAYEIDPASPGDYRKLFDSLEARGMRPETILHLWSEKDFARDNLKSSLDKSVFSLLYLSQALLRTSPKETAQPRQRKTHLLYLHPGDAREIQPHNAAMAAFAKSIMLENPRFACQSIELCGDTPSATVSPEQIADLVITELGDGAAADVEIRYQAGKRLVKQIAESALPAAAESGLKEQGVYLITGGAGGLGLIFAEFLAQKTRARLVLTGRSTLRPEQRERIQALESSGAEVAYYEADVSRYEDVATLVQKVKARFGAINGIIHAAGMLRDGPLSDKTAADMESVFAAKIYGAVNLDAAMSGENLDFFALFSSITAVTGNAGQTDYAYANSFMDHYAELRNQLLEQGKRAGRTLSFNWPLWRDGGMRADEQVQAFLETTMGIKALETQAGLETFERGLASGLSRIIVIAGDSQKVGRRMGIRHQNAQDVTTAPGRAQPSGTPAQVAAIKISGEDSVKDQDLYLLLKEDLMQLVTKTLMIREEIFSHDTDMSEYGFDSISLMRFFSELNERYSLDLTPAIFYEYPTFNALSRFLSEEYEDRFSEFFKQDLRKAAAGIKKAVPAVQMQQREREPEAPAAGGRFIEDSAIFTAPAAARSAPVIAVVGVSGVLPQSENVQAFWENLMAGKDLVTEIPSDRWDWNAFARDSDGDRNGAKWGAFMKEVDKFDAAFFGISATEARLMDPQQRIFLETVWKTIEDAGYRPSALAGTATGLFVGVGGSDYLDLVRGSGMEVIAYTSTGNAHSILANRISYLLDLRGPSEPVDTACSSSLVAIHRAVEAIASGSCEMAIAGGVNVLLSPALYMAFGDAGMLAGDGRCRTFDKSASGFVRGEGSGAVFLKTLDRAIADGDHIYGIVKGTGVNHGGHATALTAPNPNAQADLLIGIYEKAQVDPSTIGYIEAHGTGTALGDAVEINGLKKAFGELYRRGNRSRPQQPYCGIGCVKTNIGHLEAASGIAGVIKVLLSMKHKKIPGNIHLQELNPHIQLEGSPFYIVRETRDWEALQDESGNSIPRLAGVSTFGFGGANAHVILQEYVPPAGTAAIATAVGGNARVIIPLSARTREQLGHKVRDLADFVRRQATPDLTAIAYTLQVGRESMEQRLGFVVDSVEQLIRKLEIYIAGERDIEGFYQGEAGREMTATSVIGQDDDIKGIIVDKLIARRQLTKLLELWVEGLDLDWNKLYDDAKPGRLSLPTYPFARQRHWIDDAAPAGRSATPKTASAAKARLHPLLHANTSNLLQQSYSSTFSGEEFFLKDHRIDAAADAGHRILPAAACLEMARAAVEKALPGAPEPAILELRDIAWAQPACIRDRQVTTALLVAEDGHIDCEIYSHGPSGETVHCQGKALFSDAPEPATIDIARLQSRMRRGSIKAADVYTAFSAAGLNYGPAYRGITALHHGDNELLAQLDLPATVAGTYRDYPLHPSLLDGALQAAAVCLVGPDKPPQCPMLPAALESLSIVSACSRPLYAWVRLSGSPEQKSGRNGSGQTHPTKLDIDLLDGDGRVCVRLLGLSCQAAQPAQEPAAQAGWKFTADGGDKRHAVHMTAPEKIELFLKQEAALQLQKEPREIAIDKNYFELGLGSLGVANLIQKTTRLLGESLSPSIVFEHTDIRKFSAYLAQTYPAKIDAIIVEKRHQETAKRPASGFRELSPLPRRKPLGKAERRTSAQAEAVEPEARVFSEQILAKIAWPDTADAGGYEKTTF